MFFTTAQVYAYHGAVNMNESKYGDPRTFRPERYINQDGKLIADNEIAYFGFGKRRCLGEILARSMQYLFFVTLMQHFKFEVPDNVEEGPQPGYVPGLNNHPKRFKAKVTPRY